MRFGSTVFVFALASALVGCVKPDQMDKTTKSNTVGPGAAYVDTAFAATLFKNVCVATRPSFERGRKNISKAGFAKHDRKSDIYYDRRFDLSFKIGKLDGGVTRGCSMVFASREKAQVLAFFFGSVVADMTTRKPEIFISDNRRNSQVDLPHGQSFWLLELGKENGRKYYQAVIAGQY